MAVELSPIKLKKGINFFTACTLIIGNIIGSGIFITSKGVLENSGSPIVSLLVWAMSGLLTLVGAYCYTELGTLIQTSGGDYAYINESYGRLASFLYTYMIVFVIFPCITAVFGITVSVYILRIFYEDCEAPRILVRVIAAMTIVLLSVLNMYKIKLVSKIQAAFTITKICALLIIISMGAYNLAKKSDAIKAKVLNEWFPQDFKLNGIGMAFYNGLFAYSGWNCLNFLTEEMKEPEKNLPRALIISIPLITFIYLITNISYFLVLTPNEILSTEAVALTFSRKIFNQYVWLTPLFISFSTFGALSGCILGASSFPKSLLCFGKRWKFAAIFRPNMHQKFYTHYMYHVASFYVNCNFVHGRLGIVDLVWRIYRNIVHFAITQFNFLFSISQTKCPTTYQS